MVLYNAVVNVNLVHYVCLYTLRVQTNIVNKEDKILDTAIKT